MSTPVPTNGLFLSPDEVRAKYKERLKGPGGGGTNWYTDRIKGGVTRDEDGNVQRSGAAWLLQGLEKEGFGETAADRNKELRDAKIVQEYISTNGIDLDELKKTAKGRKITPDNIVSLSTTTARNIRNQPTAVQSAEIDNLKGNLDLSREELKNQGERYKLERQINQNRYDLARAEALEEKAENRRDRLDLLDRQDHRYNQELLRYDKRRQTETIQSLIGGLASLGAAFAI